MLGSFADVGVVGMSEYFNVEVSYCRIVGLWGQLRWMWGVVVFYGICRILRKWGYMMLCRGCGVYFMLHIGPPRVYPWSGA